MPTTTPTTTTTAPKTPEQLRRERRQAARWEQRKAAMNAPDKPADPNAPAAPKPATQQSLKRASMQWGQDQLQGDFSSNPLFGELTDPQYSDPTTNPHIQAMVDSLKGELKEDWLGNMAALTESAEQGGRMNGDYYAAMRTRAGEEADEALAGSIAGIYTGAYENERNRRSGLFNSLAGLQESASRLPLEWGGLQVQRGQLNLSRRSFNFDKQMTMLNGQQDALNDYFGLLSGIGGMGGTQTGSGTYQPTSNPWVAGLLGGGGGALSTYGSMYGRQPAAPAGRS